MKIIKGSKVKVIAGKFKNTIATVTSVDVKKSKVVVEGANVKKKAIKKSESNTENFTFLQHPIHISNVVLVEGKESNVEAKPKKSEKGEVKAKAKKSGAKAK